MTKTTWTLSVLLAVSVFFNMTQIAVIEDQQKEDYEFQAQQDFAIQYLGNEEKDMLDNCHEANEALMKQMDVNQLDRACKATPLPKMKG